MQSAPGPRTIIDGRSCLYFAGTGYLGLQGHPEVIRAGCAALEKYGVHSATTRAGFGNQEPVLEVERLAAEFFAAEDAFYFVSGYLGNSILATTLAPHFDLVLVDELSHYSVQESLRIAPWQVQRFRHRDPADLRAQLQVPEAHGLRVLVVSDGVFPVSGAIAPVAEYCEVLRDHPAAGIWLDDAHAIGVLGEHGRGTFEHFGLEGQGVNRDPASHSANGDGLQLYCCGTLSKAIGGSGGIVWGTSDFIARAKSQSRYYDAASSPAAPVAGATADGLRLVMREPGLRERLRQNVARLKHGLQSLGLTVDATPVPIVGLVVGDAANMQRIQGQLAARDVIIAYAGAYSDVGSEGALRIAVFANHTDAMIDQLLDELSRLL